MYYTMCTMILFKVGFIPLLLYVRYDATLAMHQSFMHYLVITSLSCLMVFVDCIIIMYVMIAYWLVTNERKHSTIFTTILLCFNVTHIALSVSTKLIYNCDYH